MALSVRSRALLIGLGLTATRPLSAEPASFEEAADSATPLPDVSPLLLPLVDDCQRGRREIDRARCRGVRDFLLQTLPSRTFSVRIDEPGVLSVSAYDAALKGFRVRLRGCLTCEGPVSTPAGGEHFVTLKVPAKGAETMGAAVTLAEPAVQFGSPALAKAWEAETKPNLRAEFVFAPALDEWTFRQHRGLAFKPIAQRVFNRCTGEVIYSEPPSNGRVRVPEGQPGCSAQAAAPAEDAAPELPARLSSAQINRALQAVREDFQACDQQFRMRGTVTLEFAVNGSGGVAQNVKAGGPLGGTGLAECLLGAARKVEFPRFAEETQTFKYPVPVPLGR